ncbi:MAG: hypothetical protein ACR2KU_06875 [Gammaproteobacteria bacterium]
MKSDFQPFFVCIGGDNSSENYLSRLFQACFSYSSAFAQCVIEVVWKASRLPAPLPDARHWECDYQPITPKHGGGRPDLCIRPALDGSEKTTGKPIFLESKVGSKLGEAQLSRYKDYGSEILVAITKNWPEVPRSRLESLKINALRWQDISGSLRQLTIRRPKDRFLCDAFAEFLEHNGMAYRDALTEEHLIKVRSLLNIIASPKDKETVRGARFDLPMDLLDLLRDVRHIFLEQHTQFANWKAWGPGYMHESVQEAGSIDNHAFGFGFHTGNWHQHHLWCGFYFPVSTREPIYWYIRHLPLGSDTPQEKTFPITGLLSKDRIDADQIGKTISGVVREWKLL